MKKSIELQISLLMAFGAALVTYFFYDFSLSKGWINAFVMLSKPYALVVGLLLYLAPIANLLLQVFSSDKEKYNHTPYYQFLKFSVHLSLVLMTIFLLAWSWCFLVIQIMILSDNIKLAITIPSIILIVMIMVLDALCQKHLNMRWYGQRV